METVATPDGFNRNALMVRLVTPVVPVLVMFTLSVAEAEPRRAAE